MTIYGPRIIYAGEDSDTYGMILCSVKGSDSSSNDEASNLVTTKSLFKESWDFHYLEYSEPLAFSITLAKQDGSYMDVYEQQNLKKWLCKKRFNWLQIDQEDMGGIWYNCIMTNPRMVDVYNGNVGMTVDVTCDTGHAWTSINTRLYTSVTTLDFSFNNNAPYDEYILYPLVRITPTNSGDITIVNNTTGHTVQLTGCIADEIITMDSKHDILESNNGRVLIDSWNKQFVEFIQGINNVTLTGVFTMSLEYRMPMRIGG